MKGPIQKFKYFANEFKEVGMIAGTQSITNSFIIVSWHRNNTNATGSRTYHQKRQGHHKSIFGFCKHWRTWYSVEGTVGRFSCSSSSQIQSSLCPWKVQSIIRSTFNYRHIHSYHQILISLLTPSQIIQHLIPLILIHSFMNHLPIMSFLRPPTTWTQGTGFIGESQLKEFMPLPTKGKVFICGPTPMYIARN